MEKNDFYKNVIPPTLKRRDQVVISRIIIRHTKITQKYILTKEDQPLCERCKTALTINQLIKVLLFSALFPSGIVPTRDVTMVLTEEALLACMYIL